ncbi:hypothetical protein, partial [Acinetobacter baumannii]|uniref:hypothetical protein n=1 Tax=Acinetobacter baumannii TaxID=470 RepID=UPI001A7E5F2C
MKGLTDHLEVMSDPVPPSGVFPYACAHQLLHRLGRSITGGETTDGTLGERAVHRLDRVNEVDSLG